MFRVVLLILLLAALLITLLVLAPASSYSWDGEKKWVDELELMVDWELAEETRGRIEAEIAYIML